MKAYWQKLALRIDAMTLRERAMVFAMLAVVLIALLDIAILDPQLGKLKLLSEKVRQEQELIAALQSELQPKMRQYAIDPNDANRLRLQQLKQQAGDMQSSLMAMGKGLVPPTHMAEALEGILKRNGRLRLVALNTLLPASLDDSGATGALSTDKAAEAVAPKPEAKLGTRPIYKHGVVITVEGSYPDLLQYVAALEAMPWRLIWGSAKLNVVEYPKTTLTLTLYTLSLDKKWLDI